MFHMFSFLVGVLSCFLSYLPLCPIKRTKSTSAEAEVLLPPDSFTFDTVPILPRYAFGAAVQRFLVRGSVPCCQIPVPTQRTAD